MYQTSLQSPSRSAKRSRSPRPPRPASSGRILALALATGCAAAAPYDVGFRGPGRLALIFEDAEAVRSLVIADASGSREIARGVEPRDARWIEPEQLLIVLEDPPEEFGLPPTRLALLSTRDATLSEIDGPRQHYDPEPSPDGRYFSVGVDIAEIGDSDLEIWELGGVRARIASRSQPLDEARWSPDGRELVVSRAVADRIESEGGIGGGGFAGVSFPWPRLFLLRRDLGTPRPIRDGATPGALAIGGTLPLWWDAAGIYARQRSGLVRCLPAEERCELVYSPGEWKRVIDGRAVTPVGSGNSGGVAWLLVALAETPRLVPTEIHRVDLATGRGRRVYAAPPGVVLVDIDWIDDALGSVSGR